MTNEPRVIPGATKFLCDSCHNEFFLRELTISGYNKACKACVDALPPEPTPTQRSLLIWLYNHKDTITIDSGNLQYAYGEIVENPDFDIKEYRTDLRSLMSRKFVTSHSLNAFYKITEEGIKYLEDRCPPQLIFQCDRCGDIWSPDIDDPMILEAYLVEHPSGHVSIEKCESCEIQAEQEDNDTEDDTWETIILNDNPPKDDIPF